MNRLFLDANILFSAAYRADAGVARLWDLEGAQLLSSPYAVEEARRNLQTKEQVSRLQDLVSTVRLAGEVDLDAVVRLGIELREKDWPILGAAIAAGATHLITGDVRDFGPFFGERLAGVLVLPPADYLRSR